MKSVTMATKREMSDYTVFFSVLGHKKFIHKILAKSESVRFQPLFKFFWCSQRIALKMPIILCILTFTSRKNSILGLYELENAEFLDILYL